MSIVSKSKNKVQKEGLRSFVESTWRNMLRRSVAGSAVERLTSKIFVEKLIMFPRLGYWPHIQNPRSFNEKILHRKLCTNNDILTTICDKELVRSYVRTKFSENILNEVYCITTNPDTIQFDTLPSDFVIKTGNKGVMIIDDKEKINKEKIKSECKKAIRSPYGINKHEYWYGNTEPKIIIEKRLYTENGDLPEDYKFYVFDGRVEYVHVDTDRFGNHSMRFYDRNWTPQSFTKSGNELGPVIDEPSELQEMIRIAEKLGADFDFIRVDLYHVENQVIFGELTPAPAGGGGKFTPRKYDFEFGRLWSNHC